MGWRAVLAIGALCLAGPMQATEENRDRALLIGILPDGTTHSLNLGFQPHPNWRLGLAGISDPNLRNANGLSRSRALAEENGYSISMFTEGRLNQRKLSGLVYLHYLFANLDPDFTPFVGVHGGSSHWTFEERPLLVLRQVDNTTLTPAEQNPRFGSSPLVFRSDLSYGFVGASIGVTVAPRDLKGFYVSFEIGANGNLAVQEKRHLYIDPLIEYHNPVVSLSSYMKQYLLFQNQTPIPLSSGFAIPWIGYTGHF